MQVGALQVGDQVSHLLGVDSVLESVGHQGHAGGPHLGDGGLQQGEVVGLWAPQRQAVGCFVDDESVQQPPVPGFQQVVGVAAFDDLAGIQDGLQQLGSGVAAHPRQGRTDPWSALGQMAGRTLFLEDGFALLGAACPLQHG